MKSDLIGGLFRPSVAFILTVGLFMLSGWFAENEKLDITRWFEGWLQIVSMLLAFYFGSRTEAKRKADDSEPAPAQ